MKYLNIGMILLLAGCSGEDKRSYHRHNIPNQVNNFSAFATPLSGALCVDGKAANYDCSSINMLSGLKFDVEASDIWGWHDPINNDDYVFLGLVNGTAFVRITDPVNPEFVAFVPSATEASHWRDVKQINQHAIVVSEAAGHGMQVVHIKDLVNRSDGEIMPPIYHYTEFGKAHNVAVNEDTNFAYVVGSNTCAGGLHMIDMNDPHNPIFAGCFDGDGYIHDVQCVIYQGVDSRYVGREMCFAASEDALTIVDVTDKQSPQLIARKTYSQTGYTHQGWLTEDHRYFFLGDEMDEVAHGINTRTLVFDMTDLTSPSYIGDYVGDNASIDHNLYVKENYLYQANYTSGVNVLKFGDLSALNTGTAIEQVAYFDTYPQSNAAEFEGVWSIFPYFDSNVIVTANTSGELFILEANFD